MQGGINRFLVCAFSLVVSELCLTHELGHHSWTLARCAEHCVGYEYPPVIFSHDEWERSRPRVSPYQTPTVPSQRATERRRIASRMGYSESGLSDSSPPTIACPRIIPSPAQLSDSDTIFTIPSPASTLVDINSVHDSKSPLTMSSNGLLGPDERYPRDASSMAFATHVSPPSYEGNLHCGAQAEPSFSGATTTLYLSNVIPDEHAYQISEKVGPHSSPDASYHLDFAGPSSYIPYVPDFQANPSFSDLPQMHTLSADVSQLPEEKQIPHFERQPAYLDNNFQVAAEYTREIPASRHSPVSFSSNEHIPPYASPVHANWQNEILAPHCHTTPGVHLTGAVYQQYESYGNSQ